MPTYERRGTALYKFAYDPRALITHMFSGRHNVVRSTNGTLYALIQASTVNLYLLRSTDDGFTWITIADFWDSQSHQPRSNYDYPINGPSDALMLAEKFDVVFGFHIRRIATAWAVYYGYINIYDETDTGINYTGLSITTDGIFAMCHNTNTMYFAYTKLNAPDYDFCIKKISPRTAAISAEYAQNTGINWENIFDLCANDDGEVFIAGIDVNNGGSAPTLVFVQFTETTSAYGTPVVIDTAPSTAEFFCDIAIARDGYETLCVAWGEMDAYPSSSTVALRYAISKDKGATWTKVDVSNETGWSAYKDAIEQEYVTRTDVIGGHDGGFLITYTQNRDSDNTSRTLVRKLSTDDGITYTLESQNDITNTPSDWDIVGAKFFDVAEGQLMNLSDAGLVRAAYQINEGDSGVQMSAVPVHIDQDILSVGPYPSTLPSEDGTYTVEEAGADELLVTFTIIDSVSDNTDFYSAGFTGEYTDTYMNAFAENGTSLRLLKYEPVQDVLMGDRSGYGPPIEYWVNAFIDPLSYGNPQQVENPDQTTGYVEQDIRKVYLPPNFHLDRSFILNNGNFLKRTVWIMQFAGNEYELTQVVPRIIHNQITHYDCNAYVVGPSHDPFSRVVLPSET
jgi:hypothetical protein